MKKLKTLLCCILGTSVILSVSAVSISAGAANNSSGVTGAAGNAIETTSDKTETTAAIVTYISYQSADEDDPNIICPEGFERIPSDRGFITFRSKVTETPDLTALTPVQHNEYVSGDFYVVDDVYVQTGVPTDLVVYNTDEWEFKRVTINRSIYDDPTQTYGTLFATMTLTAEFKWNGETAYVVGTPSCKTNITTAGEKAIKDHVTKKVDYASDQGSNVLFGNKYAYVEYIETLTAEVGSTVLPADFKLYVEVNKNGVMKTDD